MQSMPTLPSVAVWPLATPLPVSPSDIASLIIANHSEQQPSVGPVAVSPPATSQAVAGNIDQSEQRF